MAVLPAMFFLMASGEAVYPSKHHVGPVGVKATNNLRQIGIAMHNHADVHRNLAGARHLRRRRQAAVELAGGDLAVYRADRRCTSSSSWTSRGTASTTRS